ncbi:MAG: IclR family transcriptional regulator [Hyphomonadaceae bacterium]
MARAIKSAERTLAVFEAFSDAQRPLTVGEIFRSLDIPQPSASMLLRNLVKLGYLHHDRRKRTYAPTVRLVLLGSWLERSDTQAGQISTAFSQLQRHVGETGFIAIQNAAAIQYVLVQKNACPERLIIRSGQLGPLAASAAGQALLGLLPDDKVRAWVRRANAEAENPKHRICEADFMPLIARVRAEGCAIAEGAAPGECDIAIALPVLDGGPPLAAGFTGPAPRIAGRREEIVGTLRAFAAGLNPAPQAAHEEALMSVA